MGDTGITADMNRTVGKLNACMHNMDGYAGLKVNGNW